MTFYINETANCGYSPYRILLDDTTELNAIADKQQKAKGKLPLFDYSGEYDGDDWYDFFLLCDSHGVDNLVYEYGAGMEPAGEIELSEQDKTDAFKAVCDFFGGIEGYKEYIKEYGEV